MPDPKLSMVVQGVALGFMLGFVLTLGAVFVWKSRTDKAVVTYPAGDAPQEVFRVNADDTLVVQGKQIGKYPGLSKLFAPPCGERK